MQDDTLENVWLMNGEGGFEPARLPLNAYSNIRKNHQYLLAYGMKKLGGGSWAEARRACGITENFRLPKAKRRPSRVRVRKCCQPSLFD